MHCIFGNVGENSIVSLTVGAVEIFKRFPLALNYGLPDLANHRMRKFSADTYRLCGLHRGKHSTYSQRAQRERHRECGL
jgi:hypothetical protein